MVDCQVQALPLRVHGVHRPALLCDRVHRAQPLPHRAPTGARAEGAHLVEKTHKMECILQPGGDLGAVADKCMVRVKWLLFGACRIYSLSVPPREIVCFELRKFRFLHFSTLGSRQMTKV